MSTWEDRMAAQSAAKGRAYEQERERERQAIHGEYDRIHGSHHTHLDGTSVYCSCGEFHGVTCVAFPDPDDEQAMADYAAQSCRICGQRGVVALAAGQA